MKTPRLAKLPLGLASLAVMALAAWARQPPPQTDIGTLDKDAADRASRRHYSPHADRGYPKRVYFGDTHLHTSFSMDAGTMGCRLGPKDAYRFAKGFEVTSSTGQRVRLSRPLDFMAVTDHSDNLGFMPLMLAGDPRILADPQGRRWYDMIQGGKGGDAVIEIVLAFTQNKFPKALIFAPGNPAYRDAWRDIVQAADEANEPGRFTAFIGYEWTSTPGGNNLHRNVLFRDSGQKAGQVEPLPAMKPHGKDDPRDLWKWMAAYEQKTGGEVMAIAHNGNWSNGRMFPVVESFTGKPIDREYAEQRAHWERTVEATQIKGDGETHPFLSPTDEFAAFERWDKGNLDLTELKKNEMLEYEYVRSALKNGLKLEQELGTNPYKFGMIGSTDAHTGLATADQDNFFGKGSNAEPSPTRAAKPFFKQGDRAVMNWETVASGYAAVWATDNTRDALFDAMRRRETYATTGPRMTVRFFGGWDFGDKDARAPDVAAVGYRHGVPMGGDLTQPPDGKAATFLVRADKDPLGANLDRVQIIKGWLDKGGELHEKVYDVAWSGDRKPDAKTGKLPAVGDTVDVAAATWTNTIGAPELGAVWKDPDFDATQRAFYYARVIEIPTPRWTAYDANRFGVEMDAKIPMKGQQRAYTSPIWYTPAK